MIRPLTLAVALAALPALARVAPVDAAPKVAPAPLPTMPKVGDALAWPTMKSWLLEPSSNDASGKIVIHWFCTPKLQACTDDLARVITLREGSRAYVIAYINGGQRDATKLDPIRGSEGVGFGATAYGPDVAKLMKSLDVGGGPASIVVGVDGKVAAIYNGGAPDQLDARDGKVAALIGAIKDFTTAAEVPASTPVGQKLALTLKVNLASYLKFSTKSPSSFTITGPTDIVCDSRALTGDQLKINGSVLTATVNCTVAVKGVYEARGQIRFAYDSPGGATGIGVDDTTWKFEIK